MIECKTVADKSGHYGYIRVFDGGVFLYSEKSPTARLNEDDAYSDALEMKRDLLTINA